MHTYPLFDKYHIVYPTPKNLPYEWTITDTSRYNTPLDEFMMVLPRKSFPAIDYPAFIGMKEGTNFFFKHEPVIAVILHGIAKAYPLNMLTMHEISNDTLAGIPILPTLLSAMQCERRI